jgi:hypothetical protein
VSSSITLYVDGYFVNQFDACCIVALEEKGLPFATARALLRDGGGVPPSLRRFTGIPRVPALQQDTAVQTASGIGQTKISTQSLKEAARDLQDVV